MAGEVEAGLEAAGVAVGGAVGEDLGLEAHGRVTPRSVIRPSTSAVLFEVWVSRRAGR